MYTIGVLGSYVSQGVYAVAGPFQGAVDIIVVKHEDGTYKSSPWYVKCGDFQGVLTRREKIVNISVNGAQAKFYMLLNSRGEAYFEKEVETAVLALPSTSFSESTERKEKAGKSGNVVSETINVDAAKDGQSRSSSKRNVEHQMITKKHNSHLQGHPDSDPSNLGNRNGVLPQESDMGHASKHAGRDRDCSIQTGAGKMDVHTIPENVSNQSDFNLELKPIVVNVSGECLMLADADGTSSKQEPFEQREEGSCRSDIGSSLQTGQGQSMPHPLNDITDDIASTSGSNDAMQSSNVITEDWFGLQEPSNLKPGNKSASCETNFGESDPQSMDEFIWNDYKIVTAEEEEALNDSLKEDAILGVQINGKNLQAPYSAPLSNGPFDSSIWVSDALVDVATSSAASAVRADMIKSQNPNETPSISGATSEKDVECTVDERQPVEGSKAADIPAIAVVPTSSRWTMWPLSFRKSRGEKASVSESAAQKQVLLAGTNVAVGSPLTEEILKKNGYHEWTQKPKLRSYVPTSSQIASLKLKDGPNKITFFFPRVLGKTQVDANIYLWKWNTRVVISDVDGTITKSDVLGQFMPLVGRDWSHSGVTRLFSAIKENCYEFLFLSARAISQAYLTRQFLINLKQDGETLPDGPIFISPDGLIPSLYREVVRRTPHEFKISCLEGIRRLFPNDVNPFYAGFGNRDTDEISYLKVGIPKGKIFLINPKGEVMVNHHVDAKSYTSIHALVDDMFPPIYSSVQEDYNSWNFWKLPLPNIDDDELSASAKSTKVTKKVPGLKK